MGSSWLTRENTKLETENILRYIDAVAKAENIPSSARLIILGYSQGVSIASRWVARRKIRCDAFVIVSGGFPKELQKEDLTFLGDKTIVTHILGRQDPFFEEEKVNNEKKRLQEIFRHIEFRIHPGGHELDPNTLINLF